MSLHRQRPPEMGTRTTEIVSEIDRDKHILLQMLDLHRQKVAPIDLTSMLDLSSSCLEDKFPQNPTELSNTFLRRLWLYHPQTRSSSCEVIAGAYGVARPENDDSQCAINPLDLVAAVYMTTNSFLQQEITYRMVQCNFAVPLYLPPVYPEKKGMLLICPFRNVLGSWKSHSSEESGGNIMKNMANSRMPLISAVRLGQCSISKSRVLNSVLGGSNNDCFINHDMDGGQLPRVLSDGLVEVSWNLSPADNGNSTFPRPVLMANLRGDAASYKEQVSLLCYASSVLIVFCGSFGMEERNLLSSWRDNGSHLILIDCSAAMEEDGEDGGNEKLKRLLMKNLELPEESVIDGQNDNVETLAVKLRGALNVLIPHLPTTNLVSTAGMASDLSMKVDEDEISRMAFGEVEEVLHGIENGVSKFLEEQLPLQGPTWKRLCHLEKEECRLRSQEAIGEKEGLVEELMSYKLTAAMKSFIDALSTYDTTKRAFFLSWMRVKLQVVQLGKLTEGEHQQEPCLGLDHFLREMGLIYERYFHGPNYELYEMFRLPYLAAELLLYGVPLELFNGDASVFPLNWVYSVLYEVYRQLPHYTRMRVLTTLGFNNSKSAEMLSALFGVNFLKWDRRHVKGAYMLLLSLPDNIRMILDCELLMVICTEGLNSSHAREEEGRYVQDSELATFVSELSDVTLVNLPQERQAGDIRNFQIAVNAILRTKDSERRPNFQVVSEGLAKDAKIMNCIIDILTQDKSLENTKAFCTEGRRVNHNLVGPWASQYPSSETPKKYCDAALELKQSLLSVFREKAATCQPTCMGAFMEHMRKVWESVKNQNFAVGFEDTNVAAALASLCTKLIEGEEQLVGLMDHWVQELDTRISELKESGSWSADSDDPSEGILRTLGEEATMQINSEGEKIKSSLWDHLRQKDIDMALIEAYKTNLLKRVHFIQDQVTLDTNPKIEAAIVRHDLSVKMQALLTALEAALEVKLRSLLESSINNDILIDDKQLKEEFTTVWNDIPSNLEITPFETHEIPARVFEQLKESLNNSGVKKPKIKLKRATDLKQFTVKNGHFALRSKMKRTLKHNKEVAQRFTNNLIDDCDRRISEKLRHKEGYTDSYMKEVLAIVDKGLEVLKLESFTMKPNFEVDLKSHISSKAIESFQQMQDLLKRERETKEKFLNEMKERHVQDFLYNFRKRDQCQKAAHTFTAQCLRPTALDFINGSLERQILDDLLANDHAQVYASPKNFHYHLLKELLTEDSFEKFFEYLQDSENFCRKKVEDIILQRLSGSTMIEDRRFQRMQEICQRMEGAIDLSSEQSSGVQSNARLLLERVCVILENPRDVTVPTDFLEGPLFEITPQREHFFTYLKESVAKLSGSLAQMFSENENVIEVSPDLSYKLQKLVFDRMKGCDKQCPFCKSPCDLGGTEHTVHEALVHRPKGLVCYTDAGSTSLSYLTCSAEMAGENKFQNKHTDGQTRSYKDYQSIYPDWNIPPETPDKGDTGKYWKYVFMRYNTRFAQAYDCEPAFLPEDWTKITMADALRNLKEAFYITE